MGNLIFLVGAIALSVVGSVVLWMRNRPATSTLSSIDAFKREMTALGSERPVGPPAGPAPRPSAGTVRAVAPDPATQGHPDGVDVGGS